MLRKISILFLAASLTLTVGCSEDFLETKPTDSVSESSAFDSSENMFLVLMVYIDKCTLNLLYLVVLVVGLGNSILYQCLMCIVEI